MRELTVKEIKKNDCKSCCDCYKNKYNKRREKIGYARISGDIKIINLFCKYDKCPYKKDKENITYGLFDRLNSKGEI